MKVSLYSIIYNIKNSLTSSQRIFFTKYLVHI